MALTPGILARGPWELDRVAAHWREERYEPPSGNGCVGYVLYLSQHDKEFVTT